MRTIVLLTALMMVAFPVFATDPHAGHHAAAGAFDGAMATMHEDMGKVETTGDVDTDFVQGMIPHHQGAVDMAKIQLEKGTDPAIRKLAQDIIASQEKEIAMMRQWLADKKSKKE